jgi:hypothetical protein
MDNPRGARAAARNNVKHLAFFFKEAWERAF